LSQFEYITVLTSFVVAVGVSQLLSGWGRLYLNRSTASPYPLQVTASALLLVALLQSICGYWGFRNIDWDFRRFIIVFAPLLPLVGVTYLIIPPAGVASMRFKEPARALLRRSPRSLLPLGSVGCVGNRGGTGSRRAGSASRAVRPARCCDPLACPWLNVAARAPLGRAWCAGDT
jgi:hypothetical protein